MKASQPDNVELADQNSPISTKRVLVIDDNVDVAEMLAASLHQISREVIQAHDGRSGLDAALQHHPEVIVCAIVLPGLDGYKIARTLPGASAAIFVARCGVRLRRSPDRDKALAAGFSHHITKPADPPQLADLIANEYSLE